jgi:hypothetical protein
LAVVDAKRALISPGQVFFQDPKLALRIYARAMPRDAGENERLRELAGEMAPEKAPAGTRMPKRPSKPIAVAPLIGSRMPVPGAP